MAAGPELSAFLESSTGDPGPFALRRLTGGNSNETLLATGRDGRYVIRRAPPDAVDPRAHDMAREHRVLEALARTDVLAPAPLGLAEAGETGEGSPQTLLVEHVDGIALKEMLPAVYRGAVKTVAHETVDALATLHLAPWREIGLADLSRSEDFLARYIARWRREYEGYRHRVLDDFDPVADWLESNRPADSEPALMHNDFHVDNALFDRREPRLLAIIDWEITRIGEPLLDLGLMLAAWGPARLEPRALPEIQGFSHVPHAPTRDELARRYAERTGRSVDGLEYFMVFALWKLATVMEGSHAQFSRDGRRSTFAEALGANVPRLLAEARAHAGV